MGAYRQTNRQTKPGSDKEMRETTFQLKFSSVDVDVNLMCQGICGFGHGSTRSIQTNVKYGVNDRSK
jgi:hypothetical protein